MRKALISALFVVLAGSGCSRSGDSGSEPAGEEPARALPAGAIRVEKSMIVDATGFEAPMAAATLFVPSGWRTRGGVVWGDQFLCTNGYNYDWSASSPDGALNIMVVPQQKWEWNNYGAAATIPGCPLAQITSVRQYLETVVRERLPQAQLVDYRVREDLQRQFAHYQKVTPMPMGEARTWTESGELLFAYQDGGRDMRGSVAATVIFSLLHTNPVSGLSAMDALTGSALPGYAVTAPNGQLDLNFFEAIRRSVKFAPHWEARIANHDYAIGRVALEEARKRSQMIAESSAEIARIREQAWNDYQESSDRRAREFAEVIRGVETYDDPNGPGGQTQLSNLYDHAWRLDDGSYVLSNDSGFEPWRDLGLAGQKLAPTR
jgi:hypothetical protein